MAAYPYIFGAGPNAGGSGGGASTATLSVAVSDANPYSGDTITITATPTGFVPVRYFCEIRNGTTLIYVGDNGTGIFNYTVSVVGSLEVYVYADDGATVSAFNIGGTAMVVAFTPLSLASPVAGYDASDASTVTIATGVSAIANQVGGGLALVQASGSAQPQYLLAAQNGLNAIKFDGTNDFLATSAAILSGNNWYISICAQIINEAATRVIASQYNAGADGRTSIVLNQNSYSGDVQAGALNYYLAPTILPNVTFSTGNAVIEFECDAGVLEARLNGIVVATGYTASLIFNGVFRVGSLAGSELFYNAQLYEIWLFNSSQTTADKNALLSYYQNKWGI